MDTRGLDALYEKAKLLVRVLEERKTAGGAAYLMTVHQLIVQICEFRGD